MKPNFVLLKYVFIVLLCVFSFSKGAFAQSNENLFWKNVRFGGGLGVSFGDGYFSGSLSPAAIYDFNQYFSAGIGLQGSYTSGNNYKAYSYGGSLLSFFNPIRAMRISAEFELMQVNIENQLQNATLQEKYTYPALFLGVGYRSGPVVAGIRYDVLYNEDKSIYSTPVMPFVSVYF